MAFPIGNQFWKNHSKHGRDKIFSDPEILWEEACKYFHWCDEHPLKEEKLFGSKEGVIKGEANLMRAYTWSGLELFLKIYSLRDYKTNPEYKAFSQVITRIGNIIYTQKFEGAAAGLFNSNIIARDLQLVDKQHVTSKKERFRVTLRKKKDISE